MPRNEPIQSIRRALNVLLAVAGREYGVSVREICRTTGLRDATAYKIVHTLERTRLLAREKQPLRFKLGSMVEQLHHIDAQRRLLSVGAAVLRRAHTRSPAASLWLNEFVDVDICLRLSAVPWELGRVVHVHRDTEEVGLYSKASTLVFLAFAEKDRMARFLAKHAPANGETGAWPSLRRVEAEAKVTRARGHAAGVYSEPQPRFKTGAPVFDQNGLLVAAVSGSIPADRTRGRERLVAICVDAAAQITSLCRQQHAAPGEERARFAELRPVAD